MKYRNLAKWWLVPVYFIESYFLKKGFLDGTVGSLFAYEGDLFYQIGLRL